MKRFVVLLIIFVVIAGLFSAFFYRCYGWLGLVSYLVLAVISITPTVVSVYRWHKKKGGEK